MLRRTALLGEESKAAQPGGYQYSWFCHQYRALPNGGLLGAPEVELAKLRVLEHFFQHGHISTLRPPGEVFVVGVFGFPQLNEDDLGRVLHILHHMHGQAARKIAGVGQDFFEVLLESIMTAVFNPKLEDDLARHFISCGVNYLPAVAPGSCAGLGEAAP